MFIINIAKITQCGMIKRRITQMLQGPGSQLGIIEWERVLPDMQPESSKSSDDPMGGYMLQAGARICKVCPLSLFSLGLLLQRLFRRRVLS